MRRSFAAVAVGLLAVSSVAGAQSKGQAHAQSHAQAQAPDQVQHHDGFTASFGLGGGAAAVTCPGCGTSPRESALSGYLRLGGAVSPSLVIAGESNGWTKTISGTDTRLASLMAVAQWYPSLTNGFFVKGGAGVGSYTETDPSGDLKVMGLGYQGGIGYDYRLGGSFSITPYANYIGMGNGEVKVNGTDAGAKIGTSNMQYGLGLTWH